MSKDKKQKKYLEWNQLMNHVEEALENEKDLPQEVKQIYWDWLRDRYHDVKPKTYALKINGKLHTEKEHEKLLHDDNECYELKV